VSWFFFVWDGREIVATKATCCPITVSTLPKENPRQDFKKSEKKFLSPNIANLQEQDTGGNSVAD
jgi:hypothetical protein